MTPLFLIFKGQFGIIPGHGLLGLLTVAIAFLSLWNMEETFGKGLDFLEE